MENGGTKHVHAIVEERREELAALCKKHRVRRLALFGSAATGDFDPARSDLDFVVEWEPMGPVEQGSHWFGLLFDLEELFGRDVDIVNPVYVRNPYFRASMENDQVALYEAA